VVGVGIVLGLSLLIGIAVGFLAIESGSIIGVLFGIVLLMVGFISFYAGIISLGYKVMADAVAKGNQMTSRQSTQPRTQSRKPATTNRRKPKGTSSSSGSAKSQSKPGVYATIADPNSSLVSKITVTDEGEIMISLNTNSGQDKIRRAKIADFHSDNNEGASFVHFGNKKNKIAIDGGYTPVDGIALDKRETTPVEITVYKKNGRKITSLQASQFILGVEFRDNSKKRGYDNGSKIADTQLYPSIFAFQKNNSSERITSWLGFFLLDFDSDIPNQIQ
jgi:hypothetical protein